ncbi:hypothetical protein [Hymenobacter fodinae]|uniref:Uncharacterized protein n=1 Tax=Hymenobacter fodinae TaxID=2510796 RepID=A0A4Z0P480_9BACT|nr:hypothetical protein [Hymenobacter fodinae]TGE05187.1 hypothetical protein EU556_17870 [Hymenobacter fodinae]
MNDIVLRAKHWQVFLYSSSAIVLANILINENLELSGIIGAIGYFFYFLWFALLGNALFRFLPPKVDYSLLWFSINIALIIVFFGGLAILTEDRSIHAKGLAGLLLIYVFFAMLHAPWFLAVSLVAIEKQRKPEFGFYFGTFMLFLCWPIGVWVIQPRINVLWEEDQWQRQALDRLGKDK